ncbi:MAG: RraA family protein [Beutenbergiaceae bacterium]
MSSDSPAHVGRTSALIAQDRLLTTPIISDSCDAVGLRDQVLQCPLAPITPGSQAVGWARTVQFAPVQVDTPHDPYGAMIEFIDSLNRDDLIVMSTAQSFASAFWGELFSAAAQSAGATGVVTDGCLRDTPRIAQLGFAAFGAGRRPLDYRARMRVVAMDEPVRLGGVLVARGDLVVADDDGVVAVPAAATEQVLARGRERATGESTVLQELQAGASVREVWTKHGLL